MESLVVISISKSGYVYGNDPGVTSSIARGLFENAAPDCDDLAARSTALEAQKPREVLSACIEVFGSRTALATAFGPTGLCLLHMAESIQGARIYSIDTDFGFPETEDLIRRWVTERGLKFERVKSHVTPKAQAAEHGDALWLRDPDRCCAIRKVEPNERALEGAAVWVSALRRDQSATRAKTRVLDVATLSNGTKILKLCPLVTWTRKEVWSYIFEHRLPYNVLHDRGYPSVGCTHCTRPAANDGDERSGRWAGTTKTECGLHVGAKPSTHE